MKILGRCRKCGYLLTEEKPYCPRDGINVNGLTEAQTRAAVELFLDKELPRLVQQERRQPPALAPGDFLCPGCQKPLAFYFLQCPFCQHGKPPPKPDGKRRTHAEACAWRERQIAELQRRIADAARLRPSPPDLVFGEAYDVLAELFWRDHRYEEAVDAGLQSFHLRQQFWGNHTVEEALDAGLSVGEPFLLPSYYTVNAMMRTGRGREAVARFEGLLRDRRIDKADRDHLREQLDEAPLFEEGSEGK